MLIGLDARRATRDARASLFCFLAASLKSSGGSDGGVLEKALPPPPAGDKVLTAGIVEVLFALLDVNGDGHLDQEEFMTLMKRQSAVPDPVRHANRT